MPSTYNVMIMGASYGSLLATKLAARRTQGQAGVPAGRGRGDQQEGARVRLPIKGRSELVEINSRKLPGKLTADVPTAVNPADYDLVALAMQEPQYRSPGVRDLLEAVAKSKVPCMSIMNMPPLPYLKRIPGAGERRVACLLYRSDRMGQASIPDDDAVQPRPAGDSPAGGEDQRAAGHAADQFQSRPASIPTRTPHPAPDRSRTSKLSAIDTGDGKIELPVKLKVHDSIFVPLAKWAMLLTGNYRCVTKDAASTIKEAVHADLDKSRTVYNWVRDLVRCARRRPDDLVPFEKYAAAAQAWRGLRRRRGRCSPARRISSGRPAGADHRGAKRHALADRR